MAVIMYIAGLLTVPVLIGGYLFFDWAFSRTQAYGGCLVCEHLADREVGDNPNVVEWLRGQWHDLWWSHRAWHKAAVKADLAQ